MYRTCSKFKKPKKKKMNSKSPQILSVFELNLILLNINRVNFDSVVMKIIEKSQQLTHQQQQKLISNFVEILKYLLPIRPKSYRQLADLASCLYNFTTEKLSDFFIEQISQNLVEFPLFLGYLNESGLISIESLKELIKDNDILNIFTESTNLNTLNAYINDDVSFFVDAQEPFDFKFTIKNQDIFINLLQKDELSINQIPPIIAAAIFGSKAIFKFLLDRGADTNLSSLAFAAIAGGSLDIIKMLERKGINIPKLLNDEQINCLEIATQYQQKDILTYLIIQQDSQIKSHPQKLTNIKQEVETNLRQEFENNFK